MTYYETLDEDLNRARELLAKGKAPEGTGGTIYGADVYAAYRLLESFVDAIGRQRRQLETLRRLQQRTERPGS